MRQSHTVEVIYDKETVGLVYYQNNMNIVSELFELTLLLDNYNRNLVDKNIPGCVLAHRFLEQENIDCTRWKSYSKIFKDSFDYVSSEYDEYIWISDDTDDDFLEFGIIALCEEDIKRCQNASNHRIIVDLDRNIISILGFFELKTKEAYIKETGITDEEYEKLEMYNITTNPDGMFFNQLDDFYDFVSTNHKGFRIDENFTYVPIVED